MPELRKRYIVMTMAAEVPFDAEDPDAAFVLKPWKDPAALRALMTYRDNCYPELGQDLDAWIRTIASGAAVRGDVGRRNEPHVKPETSMASNGQAPAGRAAGDRGRARTVPRTQARVSRGGARARNASGTPRAASPGRATGKARTTTPGRATGPKRPANPKRAKRRR